MHISMMRSFDFWFGIVWCWQSISCFWFLASLPYMSIPPTDETEYGRLVDMVREVNDTQVDIEERLSYHVYAYNRDEEILKIVA